MHPRKLFIWIVSTAGMLQREWQMHPAGTGRKTRRWLLPAARSLPILPHVLFDHERGPSDNICWAKRCFPDPCGIHIWFESLVLSFFVDEHHITVLQVNGFYEPTYKLLGFLQRRLRFVYHCLQHLCVMYHDILLG